MTDAETPKASVEKILGDFHAREDTLESFCFRTKSLVEAILQDAEIPYQSIQFEVRRQSEEEIPESRQEL